MSEETDETGMDSAPAGEKFLGADPDNEEEFELSLPFGLSGGEKAQQDWSTSPEDASMERGTANINQKGIIFLDTEPPKYALSLKGTLPTPCHELRVEISKPDIRDRIQVEVYSVFLSDEVCVQVLEAIDVRIPLDDYPAGKYSIWVNDERIGEVSY